MGSMMLRHASARGRAQEFPERAASVIPLARCGARAITARGRCVFLLHGAGTCAGVIPPSSGSASESQPSAPSGIMSAKWLATFKARYSSIAFKSRAHCVHFLVFVWRALVRIGIRLPLTPRKKEQFLKSIYSTKHFFFISTAKL